MIDSLAIIDPAATLAEGVSIGPYTTVGPDVEIGPGTEIGSHNVLKGPMKIGANNTILQFCTLGEGSPDLKYKGEPTTLIIGDNNVIREGVTMHRGTIQDNSQTTVGSHNLFMAYAHVGHDSAVGNHCIIANNSSLAGHCTMGDWAILSGMSGVHQYGSVGEHAFIGAYTYIDKDVPAYVMAQGIPAKPRAINVEGLRRRDIQESDIQALVVAFKTLYKRKLTLKEALETITEQANDSEKVAVFLKSITESRRQIIR